MGRKRMTKDEAQVYAEEKRAKVRTLLATAMDQLTDPATWVRYLSSGAASLVKADGEPYSPRNQLLIFMQCPDAADVAGFVEWQRRGRQVRKGETGILIYAPVPRRKDKDSDGDGGRQPGEMSSDDLRSNLRGIRVTSIFSIGQTDPIEGAGVRAATQPAGAVALGELRDLIQEVAGKDAQPVLDAMDAARRNERQDIAAG